MGHHLGGRSDELRCWAAEGTDLDDTEVRLSIRIAGNTSIRCLQAIVAKGYTVTHYFLGTRPGDWDRPQWDAEKDDRRFSATGVEELLGLIAMWEIRGDDWRLKSGEAVTVRPFYTTSSSRLRRYTTVRAT